MKPQHKFTYSVLLLLLMATGVSCNQVKPQQNAINTVVEPPKPKADSFATGIVIPSVSLQMDGSQSFALYLPKTYTNSLRYPVIIFFDPHGDGTVPLNLYYSLAEKYGYLLIGSNNSKNGMNFDQTSVIANNLINEAKTRFSINDKKIAVCGFSGGAKVALLNAANNANISSVIYCGAVIPLQNLTHPLSFLGFAGTKDMNYTDEVSFNRNLPDNIPHFLIQWDGKHEWTKADVFENVFTFLQHGTVENYSKKQASISNEKLAEEQNFKQTLINAFQTENLNWWKNEIAMLNSKKKNDGMYERLLGFISLACYSYSGSALQQNNLAAAEKILAIYQLADPGNKDCENFLIELNRRKVGN